MIDARRGDVQVNELVLLLNCGWDDDYNVSLLEPIREYIPRIHGVLLTHPDVSHLGALPYLVNLANIQL